VLTKRATLFGDGAALAHRQDGEWVELSYSQLAIRAGTLGTVLRDRGIEPGDRIAILSESRIEWAIAFFAAVHAGAIVVPLDTQLTSDELAPILDDCQPRIIFASPQFVEAAESLTERLPGMQLVELGHCRLRELPPRTEAQCLGTAKLRDSTALIIYTSGTTGRPKGVMISDRGLMFQIHALAESFDIRPGDQLLSVLPLNHLLELTCGFLAMLYRGATICFAQTLFPHELSAMLRERRVRVWLGVPLLFRSVRLAIERKLAEAPPLQRMAFRLAWQLSGVLPSRRIRARLFRSIHRQFGGKLEILVSGGAPLEIETARFMHCIGLPVLEGYGLTETSPAIALNTPKEHRIGSVGRPLPGAEVEIRGGEILTRGDHVMLGYFHDEALTREVIDEDGWLRTGDLGRVDGDGFLYVHGRRKSLIVLGGGKKVQPEEVEAVVERLPGVAEACVVGCETPGSRGFEEVCAVVVPVEGANSEQILASLKAQLESVAAFKRPTLVRFREEPLPRTTTRKVRRNRVKEWLRRQILDKEPA